MSSAAMPFKAAPSQNKKPRREGSGPEGSPIIAGSGALR